MAQVVEDRWEVSRVPVNQVCPTFILQCGKIQQRFWESDLLAKWGSACGCGRGCGHSIMN